MTAADPIAFGSLADTELAALPWQSRERAVASSVLLRKAQDCLERGDWAQTCVYGWGAAEEITKAVAGNWQDYGVVAERWQDLRALVNALSITDPDVIAALEHWKSDYRKLGGESSRQALDNRLAAAGWDWDHFLAGGFSAATNLLEAFQENRATEFTVKHDLKRTARFVAQMQGWLRQTCPPEGFRQFHHGETRALPLIRNHRTTGTT